MEEKKIYYKAYDKYGNLKGKIEKNQEKELKENIWLSGVTCFVINEENKVLIEKRAGKGISPGKLDLCSGHIDEDETPTQAMIRELQEELGIQLEETMNVMRLTPKGCPLTFECVNKNRNFFIDFYCLKRNKSDVNIQKQEIDKIAWVPLEETFELMQKGKTKFPSNYNYSEIFEKVRNICNSKENDKERY